MVMKNSTEVMFTLELKMLSTIGGVLQSVTCTVLNVTALTFKCNSCKEPFEEQPCVKDFHHFQSHTCGQHGNLALSLFKEDSNQNHASSSDKRENTPQSSSSNKAETIENITSSSEKGIDIQQVDSSSDKGHNIQNISSSEKVDIIENIASSSNKDNNVRNVASPSNSAVIMERVDSVKEVKDDVPMEEVPQTDVHSANRKTCSDKITTYNQASNSFSIKPCSVSLESLKMLPNKPVQISREKNWKEATSLLPSKRKMLKMTYTNNKVVLYNIPEESKSTIKISDMYAITSNEHLYCAPRPTCRSARDEGVQNQIAPENEKFLSEFGEPMDLGLEGNSENWLDVKDWTVEPDLETNTAKNLFVHTDLKTTKMKDLSLYKHPSENEVEGKQLPGLGTCRSDTKKLKITDKATEIVRALCAKKKKALIVKKTPEEHKIDPIRMKESFHLPEQEAKESENIETTKEGIPKQYVDKKSGRVNLKRFCIECYLGLEHVCRKAEKARETEKVRTCQVCKRMFESVKVLNVHMRKHTDERPYQCKKCLKRFRRENTLDDHMLVHDGEKSHLCSVCGKAFMRKSDLYVHEQCHTEAKPMLCFVCGKTFKHIKRLKSHERIHSMPKNPLECIDCRQDHSNLEDLRLHQCPEGRKRVCHVCGKMSVFKQIIQKHIRDIHQRPDPRECPVCHLSFPNTLEYQTHLDDNIIKCSECNKSLNQTRKCILKQIYGTLVPADNIPVFKCGNCHTLCSEEAKPQESKLSCKTLENSLSDSIENGSFLCAEDNELDTETLGNRMHLKDDENVTKRESWVKM